MQPLLSRPARAERRGGRLRRQGTWAGERPSGRRDEPWRRRRGSGRTGNGQWCRLRVLEDNRWSRGPRSIAARRSPAGRSRRTWHPATTPSRRRSSTTPVAPREPPYTHSRQRHRQFSTAKALIFKGFNKDGYPQRCRLVDNHLPSPPSSCCYARCHGDVADSNKYERSDLLPGPRRRSGHAEGRPTALVAPGKNKSLATASRSQRHVNSTLQLVAFLGRHASVFRRQGNRLISPKCPRIGALEEGSRPSAVVRSQRRSKRLRSPVRPSFHWGAE